MLSKKYTIDGLDIFNIVDIYNIFSRFDIHNLADILNTLKIINTFDKFHNLYILDVFILIYVLFRSSISSSSV